MIDSYLLECMICGYEFVVHDRAELQMAHCPNCDLKKNRLGFCVIVEKGLCACEENLINMTNVGLAKTVCFRSE